MAYLEMVPKRQCTTRKNGFPQYMLIMCLFVMGSTYGPLFGMIEEEQVWGSGTSSSSYNNQPISKVSKTKQIANRHVSTTNCVRLKRAYNNVMKIYMQELPSHVVKKIEALNEAICQNESIKSLEDVNPTNQATKYSINILSAIVAIELSIFLVILPSEHFWGLKRFLPKKYCDYYKIWSTIPLFCCAIYLIALWLCERFLSTQTPPWWFSVLSADVMACISIAFLWTICKNKSLHAVPSSSEKGCIEERTGKCPRDIIDPERDLPHKTASPFCENNWAMLKIKLQQEVQKQHSYKAEQDCFITQNNIETYHFQTRDNVKSSMCEASLSKTSAWGKKAEENKKEIEVSTDITKAINVSFSGEKHSEISANIFENNKEKEVQTESLSTDVEETNGQITEASRKPHQQQVKVVKVKHVRQGRVELEPTIVVPEEEMDDLELWRQSFARSVTEDLDVKFNRNIRSVAESYSIHLYHGVGPEYERKCKDHYANLKPNVHGIAYTCMQMWQVHGEAFQLEESRSLVLQVATKWLSVVGSHIARDEKGIIEPDNDNTIISMTEDEKDWFQRAMAFERGLNISGLEGGPDNSLLYDKWMLVGNSYGVIGEKTMKALIDQII